jgi:hypothetical protein
MRIVVMKRSKDPLSGRELPKRGHLFISFESEIQKEVENNLRIGIIFSLLENPYA